MTALHDAHNHLHDERLLPWRSAILREIPRAGIRSAVINGTREADWPEVAALAGQHSWIRPAYGLHPWHVASRTANWLETLTTLLESNPRATLGEVGLDRWMQGFDIEMQLKCFRAQWRLAARLECVATVHCLRAWGHLVAFLQEEPPLPGFLLHSYSGSADLVREFASRDAYFSFSPYFLNERKARHRETFSKIPLDRLLIETDAPDMAPPSERNEHPLADSATGLPLNHPLNLTLAYAALAELRGVPLDEFAQQIESNFVRLFGQ